MALQVLIAHTGQRLKAEPGTFTSLDAFKSWVAKNVHISVQNQICLTGQGKAVRAQTLLTEREIFVFDRHVFASASPSAYSKSDAAQLPIPSKQDIRKAPDTIADQKSLEAWKDLFAARRKWAGEQAAECAKTSDIAQQRYDEIDVVTRSIGAAAFNTRTHVEGLEQKSTAAREWGIGVSEEHHALVESAEKSLAQLRTIPATAQMIRFIANREPRRGKAPLTLEDLLEPDAVTSSTSVAKKAAKYFRQTIDDLGEAVGSLIGDFDKLIDRTENGVAKSASHQSQESIQLMKDIEAIVKKVETDYQTVCEYPDTPKSVSQASKSALLHTKNYLPNLVKRFLEMEEILKYATEMRNAAVTESAELMQDVTSLNSLVAETTSRLEKLDLTAEDEEAFGYLQQLQKMPVIYASFVAEAIRRREWNEKVTGDSNTLANEMADFQDEEDKRRKKWHKSTGVLFWSDRVDSKAIGLEINVLGDDAEKWPQTSRQELEDLVATLEARKVNPNLITEVNHIIRDLNNLTKQQSKRAKAFKNGSFHETAMGRSTLLVRGDDDLIRSLQEDKSKMEVKLKGSESRVRRLEDLLHRQSQISRTPTGTIFQVPSSPGPEVASPLLSRPDNSSRRSSVSSRRFSANQGQEEKAFQQKLLSLEAELIAERERSAGLEKELSARATSADNIKNRMEEANSTKNDLLENLEAQKDEFSIERKSLESEIKRLKSRLEEYEDEMDRLLGSRENEKTTVDQKVLSLQKEVDGMRESHDAQAQKSQGQVAYLRNESKLQREANENLESQLQLTKDQLRDTKSRLERAETAETNQIDALQNLHTLLIPNLSIPVEAAHLVERLFGRSRDVVSEMDVQKNNLTIVQADRDSAQSLVADLRNELSKAEEEVATGQTELFQLRESLGAEKAKLQALTIELGDERTQLSSLRAKFADGEMGSEALRSRVQEEELKVTEVAKELAAKRSQVGSLEEELNSVQDRLQASQNKVERLSSRLESRTLRAKDLTQRLYAQNDRLHRLLDRLGYAVTREGDSMTIQRIPRAERTNPNDSSDPGSSMMRKSIAGVLPNKAMAESGDLELLYWMQNEDSETESEKYESYLKAIGYFDIEAFCETMVRRIKDAEHTARKYTKEARTYRDKSHHAQKEAHEKIAYKHFKEGDLALFLPTRNQSAGVWAAFNVGAPHYFLKEQDVHRLRSRDWLLARIHKIDERVVDLSRSINSNAGDRGSIGEASNGGDSIDDDNPFDLSDGLRWYLVDASEEKPGAPSTPGLGKSTVATAAVDATGSIRRAIKKGSTGSVADVSKTLSRSLESRRSSTNSKKIGPLNSASGTPKAPSVFSEVFAGKAIPGTSPAGPSSFGDLLTVSDATPTNRTKLDLDTVASPSPKTPPQQPPQLLPSASIVEQQSATTSTGTSPGKKSMIWDSLWSLDVSVESGKARK